VRPELDQFEQESSVPIAQCDRPNGADITELLHDPGHLFEMVDLGEQLVARRPWK
jgi:hypothetical protein